MTPLEELVFAARLADKALVAHRGATSCVVNDEQECVNETHHVLADNSCAEDGLSIATSWLRRALVAYDTAFSASKGAERD